MTSNNGNVMVLSRSNNQPVGDLEMQNSCACNGPLTKGFCPYVEKHSDEYVDPQYPLDPTDEEYYGEGWADWWQGRTEAELYVLDFVSWMGPVTAEKVQSRFRWCYVLTEAILNTLCEAQLLTRVERKTVKYIVNISNKKPRRQQAIAQ